MKLSSLLALLVLLASCATPSPRDSVEEAAKAFTLKNVDFFQLPPLSVMNNESKQLPTEIGTLASGDIKQIAHFFAWNDSQKADQIGRPIGSEGAATWDIVRALFDLHEDFAGHFCPDLNAMKTLAETHPEFDDPPNLKPVVAGFDTDKPRKGSRYTFDARVFDNGDKQWRFSHFDANPLGDAFIFRFDAAKRQLNEFIYFRDGGLYQAIIPLKVDLKTQKWTRDEAQPVRLKVDLASNGQEYELVLTGTRVNYERRSIDADQSVAWIRAAFDGSWGLTRGDHPVYIPREFALAAKDFKSAAAMDINKEGTRFIRYQTNNTLRSLKVPKSETKTMILRDLKTIVNVADTNDLANAQGVTLDKNARDIQQTKCRQRGFNQSFYTGTDDYRKAFAHEFEVQSADEATPANTGSPVKK